MRRLIVGGIGVHIAVRALAEAGERQVLVTRTVRDLATGTDLSFTPLGPWASKEFQVNGIFSRRLSCKRRAHTPWMDLDY